MNPVHRFIDAQGLACPEPLILARKALAEGGFDLLEILVDNAAARENLLKYAAYAHCPVEGVAVEGGRTRIRLLPAAGAVPEDRAATAAAPAPAYSGSTQAATVFIARDGIGQGDPDLARLLMRGFLFTLTESDLPPLRVILMNAGVKLAVEGSDSLPNLRRLAELGVDILACGTCLDFFHLTEALGVGRITNMYEIAEFLMQGPTLTV